MFDKTQITYFLITLTASIALAYFSPKKEIQKTEPLLKKFFPGKTKTFYFRTNFVVVILLGSLVGTFLLSPANPKEAFLAGLGWVSAFNAVVNVKRDKGKKK